MTKHIKEQIKTPDIVSQEAHKFDLNYHLHPLEKKLIEDQYLQSLLSELITYQGRYMFKKYPDEKPEEGTKVAVLYNGAAYATEYAKYNERVPDEDLPEGILSAIRKSNECWFMDVPIQREQLEDLNSVKVWWLPFPEEAEKPKEEAKEEEPKVEVPIETKYPKKKSKKKNRR